LKKEAKRLLNGKLELHNSIRKNKPRLGAAVCGEEEFIEVE
jgi:hypothetical protein